MGLTRPPTEAANIKAPRPELENSLRRLANRDRKSREDGLPMVDIAFGPLILWQLLESIQRIDKRLRCDNSSR
jgi:hypothetical protein